MGCCLAALLVFGGRRCAWRCPRGTLALVAGVELALLLAFGYQHRLHIATFLGVGMAQEICTAPAA